MGMKVAVSIPDPIFAEAEALAARLKTSRSHVYARALESFVKAHSRDVTSQLNSVIDSIGPEDDSFRRRAAQRVLERIEW